MNEAAAMAVTSGILMVLGFAFLIAYCNVPRDEEKGMWRAMWSMFLLSAITGIGAAWWAVIL